jgi:hypothetical protein
MATEDELKAQLANAHLELAKLELDRYRAKLGYRQAIYGAIISVGLAAAIPATVELFRELVKWKTQEAETESKRVALQQDYLSKFVEHGLNQDIELRVRLAEYFSYTIDREPSDSDRGWKAYRKELVRIRDDIKKQILEKEKFVMLNSADKEKTAEVELAKIELEWMYKQTGFVEKDRSVIVETKSSTMESSRKGYGDDFSKGLSWPSQDLLRRVVGVQTFPSSTRTCALIPGAPVADKLVDIAESGIGTGKTFPAVRDLVRQALERAYQRDRSLKDRAKVQFGQGPTHCRDRISPDGAGLGFAVTIDGNTVFPTALGRNFGPERPDVFRIDVFDSIKRELLVLAEEFHKDGWIWEASTKRAEYKAPSEFSASRELVDRLVSENKISLFAPH